jgi:hypothetical protein
MREDHKVRRHILLQNIIEHLNEFIKPQLNAFLIVLKEIQPRYENMMKLDSRVKLLKGKDIEGVQPNTLIIIDDQMSDSMKDKEVQKLFTSGVHHKSISVFFLIKNLYCQGKFSRDIHLNTHYFSIFKTPALNSQVKYLGRQIFPETPWFWYKAYKLATPSPEKYIFLSLYPTTPSELSVQNGVLPGENHLMHRPK